MPALVAFSSRRLIQAAGLGNATRLGRRPSLEPQAEQPGDVVAVYDLVEGLAKFRAGLAFGGGVVAGRRGGAGLGRADEQHAANKK